MVDSDTVVVLNKVDLAEADWWRPLPAIGQFPVSVATGQGIGALIEGLTAAVADRASVGVAPLMNAAVAEAGSTAPSLGDHSRPRSVPGSSPGSTSAKA